MKMLDSKLKITTFALLSMLGTVSAREFRVHVVQPKWEVTDFANDNTFRHWMHSQLEMVKPNLKPDVPNLVALTELNGLPLALKGSFLAGKAPSLELGLATSLIKHLPEALTWSLTKKTDLVSGLMLSMVPNNMKLYMKTCSDLAKEYNVYLVCGTNIQPYLQKENNLEISGNNLYNQSVFLDPKGQVLGAWDKVYLTKSEPPLGIKPGKIDDLITVPTQVGDIGIATSLDAFKQDVVYKLEQTGTTVLVQPDANGASWTGIEQGVSTKRDQPLAWLESSWQIVQKSSVIQYALNPMVTGNLLDISFDGQSSIIGKESKYKTQQSYVLTEPRGGFMALLPWVKEGSSSELKDLGKKLLAGSKDPLENQYKSGAIYADLSLPESTVQPHTLRPFEKAMQNLIDGENINNPLWFIAYSYFVIAAIFLFIAWKTRRFLRGLSIFLSLIFVVLNFI